ncbi:MAG: hypothetical protein PVH19_14490 [Planctomycetia bacterium]|jgi:hypothetical protein
MACGKGKIVVRYVQIELRYRVEDGMLVLGPIEIGNRCFVGIHSNLDLYSCMEDDSRLDDLSLLPEGEMIPSGKARRGSPGRLAEVELPEIGDQQAARRHPFLFGLIHIFLIVLLEIAALVTTIPSVAMILFTGALGGTLWMMVAVLIAVPLQVVWYCLSVAFLKFLILGKMTPGVYSVESSLYLRKWTVDVLLGTSRARFPHWS